MMLKMNSFVCVISCTCFSITLCTICFLYLFVACLDKISKQWNGRHISKLFLSFYSLTFLSLLPNVELVFTSDFEKQMSEREREREDNQFRCVQQRWRNLGSCHELIPANYYYQERHRTKVFLYWLVNW